jgi:KUP system potassium uptake protein
VIGQIYVGFVNWALMTLTLILTMVFRSSDSLAAAFGIPVSLTMLLTSVLMFIAMREVWRWSLPLSQPRWGCSSSSTAHSLRQIWRSFSRVAEYRLSSPAISFFLMTCWSQGSAARRRALESGTIPVPDFLAKHQDQTCVKGTAVYLAGRNDVVPVSLLQNLKHNKILHERIVLLHVTPEHSRASIWRNALRMPASPRTFRP